MKLEDQVVNLELSQRLKALGVKQESCFFWLKRIGTDKWDLTPASQIKEVDLVDDLAIAAFSVAELGELLPKHFYHDGDRYAVQYGWESNYWRVRLQLWAPSGGKYDMQIFTSEKEADARAYMLIHLIGNNLLKL